MLARFYEEMTSPELAALTDIDRALAIVPIAAVEAHGPHLPLGTDAIIADHMVRRAARALPADMPVTFTHTLRIGLSPEHEGFAGTLSLPAAIAAQALGAVLDGLARAGFARMLVISSHGGNTPVMELAAMDARRAHRALVATASWQRFGVPDGLLPAGELAHGIHGGAVETALMMAFCPDLVRQPHLADHPSLQARMERSSRRLRAHGRLSFAWLSGDLNPAGVVGDARLATPAMGEAIAAHQIAGLGELAGDLLAFDLSRLAAR